MSLNILHLSDLHLRSNSDVEKLAAKITNAFKEHSEPISPNVIVVTGDILDSSDFSSENYNEVTEKAISFFRFLASPLGINNFSEQLFFVPGNHEIYRGAEESEGSNYSGKALDRYREFLAKIYADNWQMIANDIYDDRKLCFVKPFGREKTILVGLASSRREKSGSQIINTGRIGSDQISTIHTKIRDIPEYKDCRIVACLHNNIYNTVEFKGGVDTTCVQDNESLLSALGSYNCILILHGHKHELKNRKINLSQDMTKPNKLCPVIGGGTIQNEATDSFNYFEIHDENILGSTFRCGGGEGSRFMCSEMFDLKETRQVQENIPPKEELLRSLFEPGGWTNFLDKCEIVDLSHGIAEGVSPDLPRTREPIIITANAERYNNMGIDFHLTVLKSLPLNAGTHIDFSGHVDGTGITTTVGEYPLKNFFSEIVVFDATGKVSSFHQAIKFDRDGKIAFEATPEFFGGLISAMKCLAISKKDFLEQIDECLQGKSVLIYTGLSQYYSRRGRNAKDANPYSNVYYFNPYIESELAEYLTEQSIHIIGIDTLQIENPIANFENSSMRNSQVEREIEDIKRQHNERNIHQIFLEKEIFILENLTKLDRIKNKRSLLICLPIKFAIAHCNDNSVTRACAIVFK